MKKLIELPIMVFTPGSRHPKAEKSTVEVDPTFISAIQEYEYEVTVKMKRCSLTVGPTTYDVDLSRSALNILLGGIK